MTSRRGGGTEPEPGRDVGRAVSWTLVVAASALIILAGVGWRTIATLRLRLTAAELELESVTAELGASMAARQEAARWVELIQSDPARQVPFDPTSHRSTAIGGRVLIDPDGGQVGFVFWNVPPRSHARFRVWGVEGNEPVSLGLLEPGPDGRAALRPAPERDRPLTGVRVTRERARGPSSAGDDRVVLEADLRP